MRSDRSHLELVHTRDADDAPDLPERHDELEARPDQPVDPLVFEGEIVSDKPAKTGLLPSVIVDRVTVVRTSPKTRQVVRVTAVNGALVLAGWHSWLTRMVSGLTDGVIREQIRAAKALGDQEKLAFWIDKRKEAKNDRHDRLMRLPALALRMAILTGGALLAVLLLLVILATLVWMTGFGDWTDIWVWLGGVIRWLFGAITVAATLLLVAAPVLLVVAGRREGKRHGKTPDWASRTAPHKAANRDIGGPITPSVVVTALRDLGHARLRQAIKEMGDAGASMLSLIRLAGCGVEVDVTLPSGVSTDEVQKRRRKLAENLDRHEHEVFIAIPKAARTVRLWIADSGALDEPIGPSPLVIDPDLAADLYTGRAPWGQDLRGDAALISLLQRHLLITGLSNQGKTAALRALALWLALDTSVEFRVADLKGVGDWRMFDGLATVLIQGPTDEHVIDATEMLEEGVREMESRIAALERSGATDGVTRQMARTDPRFKPLVLIVDEAQVAFMCPAREEFVTDDGKVKQGAPYGGTKATSRYFMAARKIHNQGRAVNVVLWQGTQDPTDQNLPKLVREGAHIRASLAVGTEEQARMALGDKAVDGGAAPHKLRQGLDKGTLVVAGDGVKLAAGQSSMTVRTHFISGEHAAEVADRAKSLRKGVATVAAVEGEEQPDPCEDIAAVLGDTPRMPTQEVLQRLTERNPGRYREWTHPDLKRALEAIGAEPYKSDGRMVVGRDRVSRGLAEREENRPEADAD